MAHGPSKLDAVRLATERLGGEAPPDQVAAFLKDQFGLTLQPAIVLVLQATLRERASLARSREKALEGLDQARAEMAALAEKAKAAKRQSRRKKAEPQEAQAPAESAAGG